MSVPPSNLPSLVTDRYTIEWELGAGGMATVYLARDVRHDREVALKVLRPELGAVLGADRFLSEIKITARLDHPHILTLIDSGVADGLLYYVLPYVRGESLRDRLNRETQIGIDEALTWTKQIGNALDYAHRHGVIHRDIKPENILIQEGEAILADFGIALAVKEAGGNRLTETGLSLGTPQYMSPEQATGDRGLDGRSDQYSLAAVLYEMLTGEPPISGATMQAIVAKLLTEPPTHIRTIRKTVPEHIDAAVMKALSKLPADRFASAGEFVKALDTSKTTTAFVSQPMATGNRRMLMIGGFVGAAVVIAIAGTLAMKSKSGPANAPIALRDRAQLTFTGNAMVPVMSEDGKQLAYVVKSCPTAKCTYAVNVQDVGSTSPRKIFDGATSGDYLQWSPDRRNLLFNGTINSRYGVYLLSVLGGAPRFVGGGTAAFYAGGDSLLVGPNEPSGPDSSFTVKVTGLSGDVGGTIKVPGSGDYLSGLAQIPGTSRFVSLTLRPPRGFWQIIDRQGNATDHLVNACTCGGVASSDAVWMARAGPTLAEAVVRVAIDPVTGRFATKQDTVYSGRFSGLSVSSDGTRFVVDDGSEDYNIFMLPLTEILMGKFPQSGPMMKASTQLTALVSPDGSRLLKRQSLPDTNGSSETRLSVMPFEGGQETPIELDGRLMVSAWADSVSLIVGTQNSKGLKLKVVDVRNGASSNEMQLSDSVVRAAAPVPNGWAWIPASSDRIIIEQSGKRREIPKPAWFAILTSLSMSPDGTRMLYQGWGKSTNDSIAFETVPFAGGSPTRLFTAIADHVNHFWLADGSLLVNVWDTPESLSMYKVKGVGQVEKLGTVPHLATNFNVSADLKRAVLGWRETKSDAFMYRVVKQ
jgi:hypothetical protein